MSHIIRVITSTRHLNPLVLPGSFNASNHILKRHISTRRAALRLQRQEVPYERRVEDHRIRALLNRIERYVRSGDEHAIQSYVQTKFNSEEFDNPSRAVAYEKVITSLLAHKQFSVAIELYERMVADGFFPPLFLRVKMGASTIAHTSKSRKEVYQSLQEAFAQNTFDDTSLKELIDTLNEGVKANYPSETIDRIVKLYIESQGPDYKPSVQLVCRLVDLFVRNQSPKHAKKWLDIMKEFDEAVEEDGDGELPSASSAPHAAYLKALAETNPNDTATQLSILGRMKEQGIAPDTGIFNGLMAAQVGQGNLDSVFKLYSLLLQHRPDSQLNSSSHSKLPTLIPNATTFTLLYRALKLTNLPRGVRSRRNKRPQKATSPRQLYGDMIECHLIATKGSVTMSSPVIDPTTLHLALRTFMLMGDYAAAFVVLKTLKIINIPTNLDTYQIVIKGLLRRMHHELGSSRGDGKLRWADVLLGRQDESDEIKVSGMNTDMIVQVLRYGLDRRVTLGEEPENSRELDDEENYAMPSVALIMGQELPAKEMAYSSVPLERILRRALFARITLGEDGPTIPTDTDSTPAQKVSRTIKQTKESMTRKIPSWVQRAERDMRNYRV